MKCRKQQIGYWIYGLSFFTPNYDLNFIGIQLAIDAGTVGASNLILGFGHVVAGMLALVALSLNFTIIPGNGMTKNWRKAAIVFIWLLAIAPYSKNRESFMIMAMIPPYLMWAISITILNLSAMKSERDD